MSETDPIWQERSLQCSAEQAFAVYTGRIADWWDPRYTANADTLKAVTIEPGVGGRVYEEHNDGGRIDWGEVTVWEPGWRLVHTFALAQDPRYPSEVSVEFEPAESGCVMRFAHGGWTPENVAVREKFGDWPLLLNRFAALAERG
jgi:Activator of Hsp90 ATPase homolog 1-like protein